MTDTTARRPFLFGVAGMAAKKDRKSGQKEPPLLLRPEWQVKLDGSPAYPELHQNDSSE